MIDIELTEVSVTRMGFAMLLKAAHSDRIVPVFIGPMEAFSISSALENKVPSRPLTHDLTKTILENLGYRVDSVIINDFQDGTFFARLKLISEEGNKMLDLDSRPSDAVALALRFDAPLFMEEHVFDQTSVEASLIQDRPIDPEEEFFNNLGMTEDQELSDAEEEELLRRLLGEFETEDIEEPKKRKEKSDKKSESKTPEKEKLMSREEVLQKMLKAAIRREKYEQAAAIRDELRRLREEKQGKGHSE